MIIRGGGELHGGKESLPIFDLMLGVSPDPDIDQMRCFLLLVGFWDCFNGKELNLNNQY